MVLLILFKYCELRRMSLLTAGIEVEPETSGNYIQAVKFGNLFSFFCQTFMLILFKC